MWGNEDDSGLQAQNADWVSSFERQVLELLGPEGMPQCRIRGVHQIRRASNLDRYRLALNHHGEVERGRSSHHEPQAFLLQGCESRGGHSHHIRCRRNLHKLVLTLTAGLGGAREPSLIIDDGNRGARHYCPFRVVNCAAQRGRCGLSRNQSADGEEKPNQQRNYT